MRIRSLFLLPALCLLLTAGDVPAPIAAKLVKIVSSGKVACKDSEMAAALTAVGVSVEPGAKFAWAASEGEVKSLKAAGKCVLGNKLEWLVSGATLVIIEEGGKPQMIIHAGNLTASGATLPEVVLKVSKRQ
ncbi:MAG TPA: hypothetical protein VJ623_02345 [Holophagaceae bacterium]|nr:hypothetical protein [Holophagaceae bacterium]